MKSTVMMIWKKEGKKKTKKRKKKSKRKEILIKQFSYAVLGQFSCFCRIWYNAF